jgi:pilus assembly protein Flp/PilA
MLQYFLTYLQNILPQEEGQDLAEYAILLGLIALVVLVAVTALGGALDDLFQSFADEVGTWFTAGT